METQSLLVPEPVDLAAAEAAAALENRDLLAKLGMKIEPFGGDTMLITGFPAMLANMNPVEVLRGLLERLLSGGKPPERRDLLDDLLHTIACKAAVQGGRPAGARGDRGPLGAAAPGRRRRIIVRTAGRRRWSSPARSWTGSSKGFNMICVCIGRGRHRHVIAEHRHLVDQGARLAELRLDYLNGDVNLRRLIVDRPSPVIITCRRQTERGQIYRRGRSSPGAAAHGNCRRRGICRSGR